MGLLIGALLFFLVFVMPSYMYYIYARKGGFERFIIYFVSSIFIIPVVVFFLSYIFSTSINYYHLLIIGLGSIIYHTFRLYGVNLKHGIQIKRKVFLLLIILVFIVFFFNFEGLNRGYWDSYITFPAQLMNGDYVELTDFQGGKLYDYTIDNDVFQDLVKEKSFGLSTKDQRIGAGIFYSIPYMLFGKIGFRLFYALLGSILFILGFFISKELRFNEWIPYFGGLLFALSPYVLNVNRLNPNFIALVIITFMIYLLLLKKHNWFLLGMILGVLGGIRNVALILIPAFIFILIYDNVRKTNGIMLLVKKGTLFIFGAFLIILPILLWNNYAFGNPLEHPTQYPGLYGFRPTFTHEIFGLEFDFNGLLNYPFADSVVRTPHYPFPTFLTLPLLIVNSLGLVLFSAALYGMIRAVKNKRLFYFLMLLFLPFYLFLSFQENWEDVKSTFMLMLFPSLFIFVLLGVDNLSRLIKRKKIKLLFPYFLIILLVFIGVSLLVNLEFTKDDRWFQRFPEAANSTSDFVYEDSLMRDEWNYFHTDESLEEVEAIRNVLMKRNFLPDYSTIGTNLDSFNDDWNSGENSTMVDVWRYIY